MKDLVAAKPKDSEWQTALALCDAHSRSDEGVPHQVAEHGDEGDTAFVEDRHAAEELKAPGGPPEPPPKTLTGRALLRPKLPPPTPPPWPPPPHLLQLLPRPNFTPAELSLKIKRVRLMTELEIADQAEEAVEAHQAEEAVEAYEEAESVFSHLIKVAKR